MPRDTSVMRAVGIVGRLTALSRLAGLVRDQLMAHAFGASPAVSAFYVAFRMPNLLRRLFGEGALSAAFVPVFTERVEQKGLEDASKLAGRMFGLLSAVLGLLTAFFWLAARLLEFQVAPDGRTAAVLSLLRIMLPYGLLICQAALLMGMLNALRRFAIPSCVPVLLNLVWIGTLLLSRPLVGDDPEARLHLLAWGVVLAGALQMIIQIPVLRRAGLHGWPRVDFRHDPDVAQILQRMAPAALGMGVVQINVFLDSVLALIAAPWAPAALFYAERLVYLPLGLFATALGTVLLPACSRRIALSDTDGFRETLHHALLNVLGIMAPAAALLTVLAGPAVALVFSWRGGQFGPVEVARTARALSCYAPGLLVFSLYKALTPAYYARKDTRTPVRIAVVGVLLNLGMNVLVVLTWPTEWRHAGLALSTVLSSVFNVVGLLRGLARQPGILDRTALAAAAVRTLGVAAVTAGGLAAGLAVLRAGTGWESWNGKSTQFAILVVGGLVGSAFYLAVLRRVCPPVWAVLRELWTRNTTDSSGNPDSSGERT